MSRLTAYTGQTKPTPLLRQNMTTINQQPGLLNLTPEQERLQKQQTGLSNMLLLAGSLLLTESEEDEQHEESGHAQRKIPVRRDK
jgi:hypothetical protein